MRPKVISNRITKDTPNVEENEDAGRQASQPRHNGAICSFTKAADEEGQKSQLVKESIVKECVLTYADIVENGKQIGN